MISPKSVFSISFYKMLKDLSFFKTQKYNFFNINKYNNTKIECLNINSFQKRLLKRIFNFSLYVNLNLHYRNK